MSHSIQPVSQSLELAFQAELAEASRDPSLRPVLRGRGADLWPRFARFHTHLSRLPRRARRALQRRLKRPLTALALLMALGQVPPALAATIAVNGTGCTLIDAITAANTDTIAGGCLAGSGADTLVLARKRTHTLTAVNNAFYGNNGLPVITSKITIEGRGSTIRRDAGAPDFRIFAVGDGGDLTLNETTVSGGLALESGRGQSGGGIFNYSGTVTIRNSNVSGNTASSGGGVASRGSDYPYCCINSTLTITNSTIADNIGGGVSNLFGTASLLNSTVSGNIVPGARNLTLFGSGVTNDYGEVTVTNSTVSNNGGSGLFNHFYSVMTLIETTVTGNRFEGVLNDNDAFHLTLSRSLISGNKPSEVYNNGYLSKIKIDDFNLFGHAGITTEQALNTSFTGLVPGPTDITATSDGTDPTALSDIFNPTLTFSGGKTPTHNLVLGSPAVDAVTTGCPPPATDQRGVPRPQGAACDIGAVELVTCRGKAATLVGTAGNDVLKGTRHADVIHGLAGNDRIFGRSGNDILCGGSGNDQLKGQGGYDQCDGGSGTDGASSCETRVNIP